MLLVVFRLAAFVVVFFGEFCGLDFDVAYGVPAALVAVGTAIIGADCHNVVGVSAAMAALISMPRRR